MRLLIAGFVLCANCWSSGSGRHDPDEGMEGSIRLGIPEPMVFDLVRPLGAAKGEFEINSLFRLPTSGGRRLGWAPELEYCFRRGTAVELELPMEGRSTRYYKVALQQKLPMNPRRRIVHGLQGIGEVAASGEPSWNTSALYIFGVRWHERWSSISMVGANLASRSGHRIAAPLSNHAVFHERWKRTALGLEWNMRDVKPRRTETLLIPQVHFRVLDRVNLQFGAGYSRKPGESTPLLSWRLIREL